MPPAADDTAAPGTELDQDVRDLYSAPVEEFVPRRDALVAAARADGDRVRATALKALRKPTAAAAVLNALSRSEPQALADYLDLAGRLRTAQARLKGDELRRLGRERQQAAAALVGQAGDVAGARLTAAVRTEVEQTLQAAVADPQVGDAVASGCLTRAIAYAGFGEVDLTALTAVPTSPRPTRDDRPAATDGEPTAEGGAAAGEAGTATPPGAPSAPAAGLAQAARTLAQAQDAAETARSAVEQARASESAAVAEHTDAQAEAEDLRERLAQARFAVRRAQQQVHAAQAGRLAADRAAATADKALDRARRRHDQLTRGGDADLAHPADPAHSADSAHPADPTQD